MTGLSGRPALRGGPPAPAARLACGGLRDVHQCSEALSCRFIPDAIAKVYDIYKEGAGTSVHAYYRTDSIR